jgi:hypothetical protein
MGAREISRFLTSLATEGRVSASTQNQALSALLFLYQKVLGKELDWIEGVVRAKRPVRLPVVLTREEVGAVLERIHGTPWIMASLLYGAGLRLLECARLRVKDIDFVRSEIVIRDGKGRKDRVTVLPESVKKPLAAHLQTVHEQHRKDILRGAGTVALPTALARKYPAAGRNWAWHSIPRRAGMIRLIGLVLLLAILGCTDDEILVVEPEPVDLPLVAELSLSDSHVRLDLEVFRRGTGIFLKAIASNEGTEILRYDSGGCGCQSPGLLLLNEDGDRCRGPEPLCPCWSEIVELGPQKGSQSYTAASLCSGPSGRYVAMATFRYWTGEYPDWESHSIEVSIPLSFTAG